MLRVRAIVLLVIASLLAMPMHHVLAASPAAKGDAWMHQGHHQDHVPAAATGHCGETGDEQAETSQDQCAFCAACALAMTQEPPVEQRACQPAPVGIIHGLHSRVPQLEHRPPKPHLA
ncbi:hypothetical protein CKO35_13115 [Ectothiorhodospira shaposhnikovii]|uniref:hypothetical protein n=1 Tax=Ectothiorhodospira shaposhnikovii TaxID=1054 RepID=UPI001907227C|nr:hypothetical protein [Ectothiorhodospira shaposhnikovii]MBK1674227.1 hypothetical protein [Ectothiorhodospira shaposhnikovii]